MNNQIFLTLLVFALTWALINAQTSPSNCVYNGIDYSGFSNTTNSWSFVAPRGDSTVTYYWNVCNVASKCSSVPTGAAVCQYQLNYKTWQYYSIGDLATGTFTNVDVGVGIKYTTTNNLCKNGNYRTTTVVMICDPNKENSVVSAQENPVGSCLYQVILSGKSACRSNSTSTTGSTSSPSTTGTTTGTTTSPSGFNNVQSLCFTKISDYVIRTIVTFNDGYVQIIDNTGTPSKACVDYNGNMQACFESNPNGNELCVTYNGGQPICESIDGKISMTCLKASHQDLSSKPTIKKNGDQVHIDFTPQESSSSTLMINSLFIILAFILVSLF
ncbi:hypothetical protein CYY_006242 [Polysphondylium violaceum]|uniref:MRH domain-containing protein n=1 Tax=Polysphondylium violaceum TaxID=133409 RepID=A0A8J4V651_9MYCE|nr:hypothetical protein CYY_006242 [Polysphondylium violaceum]